MITKTFTSALEKTEKLANALGITVLYPPANELDPFFKGDLDGKTIYISNELTKEEKLFDLLHLIGHTIQWNVNEQHYELGSVLHSNPSEGVMALLYAYEWEANCYGLYILEYIGHKNLRDWLYDLFKEDINYLMEFYKSGKKEKILPEDRVPVVELFPKPIPYFTPKQRKSSREGIVIGFPK